MLSQILVTGMKPRIKLLGLIATLGTAALSSGAGAQYAPAEVHIEAAPAETAPSAALVGPAPHPIAASQASSGQRRSGHRTAPVTATGDGEAYVQQLVAGRSQRKSALRKPVEGKRAAASMAHRPSESRQSRSDSGRKPKHVAKGSPDNPKSTSGGSAASTSPVHGRAKPRASATHEAGRSPGETVRGAAVPNPADNSASSGDTGAGSHVTQTGFRWPFSFGIASSKSEEMPSGRGQSPGQSAPGRVSDAEKMQAPVPSIGTAADERHPPRSSGEATLFAIDRRSTTDSDTERGAGEPKHSFVLPFLFKLPSLSEAGTNGENSKDQHISARSAQTGAVPSAGAANPAESQSRNADPYPAAEVPDNGESIRTNEDSVSRFPIKLPWGVSADHFPVENADISSDAGGRHRATIESYPLPAPTESGSQRAVTTSISPGSSLSTTLPVTGETATGAQSPAAQRSSDETSLEVGMPGHSQAHSGGFRLPFNLVMPWSSAIASVSPPAASDRTASRASASPEGSSVYQSDADGGNPPASSSASNATRDDPAAEVPEAFRRQVVNYETHEKAGTIIIDTTNRYLYLVLRAGKAIRYGIGVGREGFTWSGSERISSMKEWPDWFPPKEMIERQPYLPRVMIGGPGNPLGARALYLGHTLYRIHGTNEPNTIGKTVSSGCIRLINEDIEDLYQRVSIGTKVIVLPTKEPYQAAAEAQRRSNGDPASSVSRVIHGSQN